MIPLNRQVTITMAQTQIDMLPPQHFDSLPQPGAESDCDNTGCFNREAHRGADTQGSRQKASCLLYGQGRHFKEQGNLFKEVIVRSCTRIPSDINAHCQYSVPPKRIFVLVKLLSPWQNDKWSLVLLFYSTCLQIPCFSSSWPLLLWLEGSKWQTISLILQVQRNMKSLF